MLQSHIGMLYKVCSTAMPVVYEVYVENSELHANEISNAFVRTILAWFLTLNFKYLSDLITIGE